MSNYLLNPRTRDDSIDRIKGLFEEAGVSYNSTATGREIIFDSPAGKIKINHNGAHHWTMRVPGMAKDGIRFQFNVTVSIDPQNKLILFNDVMAVRYV